MDTPRFAKNTWAWNRTVARVAAQNDNLPYEEWTGKQFAAAQVIYRNTVRKYQLTGEDDHPPMSFMEGIEGSQLMALSGALWFISRGALWAESGDGVAQVTFERQWTLAGYIPGYGYSDSAQKLREGGLPKGKLVVKGPRECAKPSFFWALNGDPVRDEELLGAVGAYADVTAHVRETWARVADELDEGAARLRLFDELPAGVDEPPNVDHAGTADVIEIEAAALRAKAREPAAV